LPVVHVLHRIRAVFPQPVRPGSHQSCALMMHTPTSFTTPPIPTQKGCGVFLACRMLRRKGCTASAVAASCCRRTIGNAPQYCPPGVMCEIAVFDETHASRCVVCRGAIDNMRRCGMDIVRQFSMTTWWFVCLGMMPGAAVARCYVLAGARRRGSTARRARKSR
jgi:hypothetical protein